MYTVSSEDWLPVTDPDLRVYVHRHLISDNPPIRNLEVVQAANRNTDLPSDEPQVDSNGITFHNYVANYGNTNHIGWDHLSSE